MIARVCDLPGNFKYLSMIVFVIISIGIFISADLQLFFRKCMFTYPENDNSNVFTSFYSPTAYESPYEGRQILRNCEDFKSYADEHGYCASVCPTRLGNQLGLLAFGLAVNLQFGIKLMLTPKQQTIISQAFNVSKLCQHNDGSAFCLLLPKGKILALNYLPVLSIVPSFTLFSSRMRKNSQPINGDG